MRRSTRRTAPSGSSSARRFDNRGRSSMIRASHFRGGIGYVVAASRYACHAFRRRARDGIVRPGPRDVDAAVEQRVGRRYDHRFRHRDVAVPDDPRAVDHDRESGGRVLPRSRQRVQLHARGAPERDLDARPHRARLQRRRPAAVHVRQGFVRGRQRRRGSPGLDLLRQQRVPRGQPGDQLLRSYFNSSFTSANTLVANSRSSRECAAETCVRTRAVPCGTTG